MRIVPFALLVSGVGALAGCGDDTAEPAELQVTVYGEELIESGIPASEMDDGWDVEFRRFDVVVSGVHVADTTLDVDEAVDLSEPTDGAGTELASLEVWTGDYMDAAYTLGPIHVEGRARKDGVTKTFEWEFDEQVRYTICETTTEVRAGETATFEITVHADHLFYDSLVADEPQLLFQALADADTDDDGEITAGELEAADLGGYDPGSDGAIEDLWRFLEAQVRTLGHVDGEGHCQVSND